MFRTSLDVLIDSGSMLTPSARANGGGVSGGVGVGGGVGVVGTNQVLPS